MCNDLSWWLVVWLGGTSCGGAFFRGMSVAAPFQSRLEATIRAYMEPEGGPHVDFRHPEGEPALAAADSLSWRVFKNPVALFIGGVAAVILELAEPRVRSGVWEHTSFRHDPTTRLKRTGLAAMVTVYAPRSVAERMIGGVGRMHGRVSGVTANGTAYRADDPELLDWVQATASFGFLQAYHSFVQPLSREERDCFYAEAAPAARLYGATGAPTDEAELEAQFAAMRPKLEASPVVFEFLEILRRAPAFPPPLRPLQALLIRAAVEITPRWARDMLGLGPAHGLRAWEKPLVLAIARVADRIALPSAPPVQASLRMGLAADALYRRPRSAGSP
jgi:uncharacterized protein (DUF2236 family)